jgi:hypothetical protein
MVRGSLRSWTFAFVICGVVAALNGFGQLFAHGLAGSGLYWLMAGVALLMLGSALALGLILGGAKAGAEKQPEKGE